MKKYSAILPLLLPSLGFSTTFSTEEKNTLINKVAHEISRQYVLQENIPAIRESLQKASESEAMKQAGTPKRVAEVLSKVLEKHDKHFGVRWYDQNTSQSQPKHENWFTKLARKNSGFNRIEVLEGNVGYIDFWGFDQVNDASRKRVEAAMTLVENTDAIIFDLRNNGGGDGNMGRLISSYLFDEPTHLNSIYWKATDSTTEFWTFEIIKGKRMIDTPVFILTSKDTFSAAESFAYYLKHLKRATIIGETTKGGANPWQFFQLDDGFGVVIPIAKAVNPITKSNWEGTGVEPDIKSLKEDAFNIGYRLSLQHIQSSTIHPEQLKEVKEQLKLVETH
ncbi:S41 family peptidase [Microbulbifer sp. THAF38]|uniref:S41 family peptidase n=1 Tax=Microbulbifer sp. THAF38 TaxID=2587856 RepID=UPI00126856AD|nr:S41 family peptidase [Microbulbifer sp. THAF38]QFT53646.1 carboxy-terminal protease [Microbulbifer sp. THAF38]